jgi:hypothetical protein
MNTVVRAALFVAALATVFAAAFGIGTAYDDDSGSGPDSASTAAAHDEYELRLLDPPTTTGAGELRFVVENHDGIVVTDFDVRHEKRLHLILVDTAYTGFQHVHPTMAADGVWTTPLRVAGGRTEVYADFRPTGGDDVVARARFDVEGPLGSPAFSKLRTQQVDGYTVTVLGDLAAGGTSALRFEISRGGRPVTDLEPYLGAYGHLVMLRKADGEYLHVHPEDGEAGPQVAFAASIPSAARYHLYLDFKHAGKVRTAMFVLDAGEGAGGDHGEEAEHGEH